MSSTVTISRCGLTLHDVRTQTTKKSILRLIKKYFPNVSILKINPGDAFYKNGKEVSRIYIMLDKPESVDELMKNRSYLQFNGEQLRVTRTLPKSCPLYDRSVTGLKIKIYQSVDDNASTIRLNELDLRKHFQHFGIIRYCEWTNVDQSEALFAFSDFDSVDQIILSNPSPEIKGVKVDLEKTWTNEDYTSYERPYVIHVTNLPLRVTSEEISTHFKVPIAVILLYPCFRLEQERIVDGRSSSEAWIKNFTDEKTAKALAEEKTGTFVRTNKIQCEAMLETIDNEQELCERFQRGQCPYTMNTCHYKHFSCSEPDTCDDINCWFGHTNQRTTISINRPIYRSEYARYRVKFSNLPSNVTKENLMVRLRIDSKSSDHLILQPAEENPNSPKMAYLIHQPLENKLRQQIDKWHNTSFSLQITRKIQCQLEINQELVDWSDSTDTTRSRNNSRCVSPTLSMHSARSSGRANLEPQFTSAAGTSSCRPSLSKEPHTVEQSQIVRPLPTHPPIVQNNKPTTNTLKSKSVAAIRQPPSDFSSLSTQWRWTNQMVLNDQFDRDELYWVEGKSNKEKNVVTKIYSPTIDQTAARVRAQRERIALEYLKEFAFVPKLLNSNVNVSNNDLSKKELWTIMKLIHGERLSDYIKGNRPNLKEALKITQQLLNIIKEIHSQNVIHRNIQPKSILVQPRSNNNVMNFMLIDFGSAWVNDHQWTSFIEDSNDQLGNSFYRMPQFETREGKDEQNQNNEQLKQFQYSPTIDTTGICAILFWMITGHEPKESQDISKKTPHMRYNPKIIENKINEVTAFRMELGTAKHLYRHLMLIFDRSFGAPNQQWSVDELDYQLQFMVALIEGEKEKSSYIPSTRNTNDYMSLPFIPLGDPFVYVVSLIHHLKNQFAARYSNCIRWSTGEKNRWCSQDRTIENYDLMIFSYQSKNLSVDVTWHVTILKEKQFIISIKAKDHNKINILLPLGLWKINEKKNDFDVHLKYFEMEMKILINILCQSIAFENN